MIAPRKTKSPATGERTPSVTTTFSSTSSAASSPNPIARPPSARRRGQKAAERRFVERYGDELDDLGATAPPEIRNDVQKVLAGTRQRAGLEAPIEVPEAEVDAADERVRAFEERAC